MRVMMFGDGDPIACTSESIESCFVDVWDGALSVRFVDSQGQTIACGNWSRFKDATKMQCEALLFAIASRLVEIEGTNEMLVITDHMIAIVTDENAGAFKSFKNLRTAEYKPDEPTNPWLGFRADWN